MVNQGNLGLIAFVVCMDRIRAAIGSKTKLRLKLLFTISVVRDRLHFMTEIPCTDHSLQKSLCGERL